MLSLNASLETLHYLQNILLFIGYFESIENFGECWIYFIGYLQ